MKRVALLALLLAAPAQAQDVPMETVNAYGNSLVGVWHGTLGQASFFGIVGTLTGLSPPLLGQMVNAYCRIAPAKDELQMSCMQFGRDRVTLKDGRVRIGDRVAFEGEQTDATHLRGRFKATSWLGISKENPIVSEAVRLTPQTDAPDTAGKAPLLRRILEQGLAGLPQDAEALKKNESILALPRLGAVQSLSYLGQETKWDWPPPPGVKADRMNVPNRPDFFSVYFVKFAEGERLCGLHQRDDGVLDALRCV